MNEEDKIHGIIFPNIFIWGLSGSGKDTLSNFMVEEFGYLKVRIADTIKRIIMEQENLTFEELEEQKRINPELRNRHHEVGLYMDAKDGTKHRIGQIIRRKALDIVNLPEEIRNKNMVVCDCRGIEEAKQFLDAGWYGIYLNRKPNEYRNEKHWTEKDMFENGDLKELLSKYGNKNILCFNNQQTYPSYDAISDLCKKVKASSASEKTITMFPREDYFIEDMKLFLYKAFEEIYKFENQK